MIYLGIGSNIGNGIENFRKAVLLLEIGGVKVLRASPVFETAAFLPKGSSVEWNKPYKNAVLEVATGLSPVELLSLCKKVEKEMGARHLEKWAPREIDIDIIF